jgi:hypothetical protein
MRRAVPGMFAFALWDSDAEVLFSLEIGLAKSRFTIQ